MKNNYLGKVAKDKAAEVKKLKKEKIRLEAKIVLLEGWIKCTGHEEFSHSLQQTQELLNQLYAGQHDAMIAKSIKECEHDWREG